MNRGLLTAAAVCLVVAFAGGAEPVHFVDPNLKAIVEKTLGRTDPTADDMLQLTRLYAGTQDISDLTGLEYARNLTSLCLHRNKLSDISPIAGLTELTYLCVHDNAVEDISAVKDMTKLVNLLLYGNKIKDLSPVRHMMELTNLYVNNNCLMDIAPLAGLEKLRFLDVGGNELADISPAASLAALTDLCANNNHIADLTPLENREQLKTVRVFGNPAPIPAKWIDGQVSIYLDAAQYAKSFAGTPKGKLVCKGEIGSFMVSRGNCFIRMSTLLDSVELPAGPYGLANWEMERNDSDGILWKLTASWRVEKPGGFTVAGGQTQTLEIGEPLAGTVTARKTGSGYTFGQTISGRMGESISITREGARPAPPKLHIRNREGDYEQTYNFAYG